MSLKENLNPQALIKRFQSHKSLKAIIANVGWLFFDFILRMIIGLLVGAWIARYLGAEKFGLLNIAISIVAIFNVFSSAGASQIIIKALVESPKMSAHILGTSLILNICGGCTASLLSCLAASLLYGYESITLALVFLLSFCTILQSFEVINIWFQSQTQSRITVPVKSIVIITSATINVLLILSNSSLINFAVVKLIESFLNMIGLIVIYRINRRDLFKWSFNLSLGKGIFRKSFPLILTNLAVIIYVKIDLLMLSQMSTAKEVGLYAVATRLSEIWYFVPSIITQSLFPSLIAAKKISLPLYDKRLKQIFLLMSVVSIIISLSTVLCSKYVILLLFGESYISSSKILSIHIWSCLFVFLGGVSSQWLIIENLVRYSVYRTVIGCLSNIALNIILIPQFGALGAALATVVSYAIATFSLILFRETRVCGLNMLSSVNILSTLKS